MEGSQQGQGRNRGSAAPAVTLNRAPTRRLKRTGAGATSASKVLPPSQPPLLPAPPPPVASSRCASRHLAGDEHRGEEGRHLNGSSSVTHC
jgi:hypothetical protein